ncbi:MAG: hypothetical protein KDK70_25455, partial [Myxococcales bacterium]|nr:hypothetical protein [Myxococcales bacterium]
MCGIVGMIDYGRPAAAFDPLVARMAAALHHRGPDDRGQWRGRHAVLGHTRLALLDPRGGAQPMQDPSGRYVLAYNGEVYVLDELRAQLRDRWVFRTRSDTEVVLAALVVWGEAALPRLDGMFALSLWDEQRQQGLLARDRLGVKPLAYQRLPDGLRFASEAKALVAVLEHRRPQRLEPAVLGRRAGQHPGAPRPAARRHQRERLRILGPRPLGRRPVVPVGLGHHQQIRQLQDPPLDPLQPVAAPRQREHQEEVDHVGHHHLRLPHAHRLHQHHVVAGRLHQHDRLAGPPGHAPQRPARRRRPDERGRVVGQPGHAGLVAHDAAPAARRA